MQFKIISNEVLRECLSNYIKHPNRTYESFSKFVKLNISKEKFEEYKVGEITLGDIKNIVSGVNINTEKEVGRIKLIWGKKEEEILKTMNNLTGLSITSKDIICYIDPYQRGGYYGEDNITVGTFSNSKDVMFVIAHELFHIFYWSFPEQKPTLHIMVLLLFLHYKLELSH